MYTVSTPFNQGRLSVSPLHEIAFWEYGNPQGQAAVYLHGGPGAGSNPSMTGFFNSQTTRTVLFDQRGCGQSTPHAELTDNTTWALVADMEKLREHLNIERWLVCGGSWGSALALAYAQTHPQKVSALIVRGIFTLRRAELLWFYQEGASWLFPDFWEDFIAPIPPAERGDLISAYHRRLTGNDETQKLRCAKAWSVWEAKTLSMMQDAKRAEEFSAEHFALAFARIESHYFVNGGFFEHDGQLIANAGKLADIPGVIVQGRYDAVTPMKTAWELHRAWQKAKLITIPDAGHAATEPGIAKAICDAADDFCAV